MTEQADQFHDQFHHDKALARSTALGQAFFFFDKASYHPDLSALLQPRFGSLRLLVLPNAKIAVDRDEIWKCDRHTVHKLS